MFIALSLMAGLFEFVYFPAPWLKFDLSETVILFAVYAIGPLKSAIVVIMRSLIRWLLTSGTNIPFPFFGELLAITASLYLIFITMPFLSKSKVKLSSLGFLPFMIIMITIFMTTLNFLITTPAFMSKGQYYFPVTNFTNKFFKGSLRTYLDFTMITYIPFNSIKYAINLGIAWPIILSISSFHYSWSKQKAKD